MRILIVGPSWVGDMVMAQTLFQCLKQQHPDWTDQQITQARHAGDGSFNQFMQDDQPVLS